MPTHPDFLKLKRGDGIVLFSSGTTNPEYAIVHTPPGSGKLARALKWRPGSRSWSNPVRFSGADFVRRANVGEFHVDPLPPGALTR